MKLKTLAIATLAGLFAVSLAYAGPAATTQLADDMSSMDADTGNTTSTPGGDNIGNPNADGLGSMQANNDTPQVPTSSVPSPNPAPNPNQSSNNDDMSADTATGDDDY